MESGSVSSHFHNKLLLSGEHTECVISSTNNIHYYKAKKPLCSIKSIHLFNAVTVIRYFCRRSDAFISIY